MGSSYGAVVVKEPDHDVGVAHVVAHLAELVPAEADPALGGRLDAVLRRPTLKRHISIEQLARTHTHSQTTDRHKPPYRDEGPVGVDVPREHVATGQERHGAGVRRGAEWRLHPLCRDGREHDDAKEQGDREASQDHGGRGPGGVEEGASHDGRGVPRGLARETQQQRGEQRQQQREIDRGIEGKAPNRSRCCCCFSSFSLRSIAVQPKYRSPARNPTPAQTLSIIATLSTISSTPHENRDPDG